MAKQSSKDIENKKAVIERARDKFIGKLEADLKEAEQHQMTDQYQEQLKTQIDQAVAMYGGLLEKVDLELKVAKAADDLAKEKEDAEIQSRADATTEQIKSELRSAWLEANGDPDVFEEHFPALYAAEMSKRAQAQLEEARRAQMSVTAKAF